ncbi:metal resistance protein YCF1-like [Centruroides sculpturatus]|uniref:metal resistance protein YCF1-like n=1 Tax=Centruroides sculpturatus TaxID=218467 RepID=UPI000C6D4E57|nr:metal resistance protein YCF1-like [Centruroides sculpturatus]
MENTQKSNPFDSAGVFSHLFFCWIFSIVIKGSKRPLKEEDLYETSKYHTSEYLGDLLQKEWNKELKQRNPSILKALLRFVGWKYLIILLLAIIKHTVVIGLQAYLLIFTIHYFENRVEWNQYNVYLIVAGFFGITLMQLD